MPWRNGDIGEGAVLGALIRLGCIVLVPFGQGQAYDLVVDRGSAGFVRIQCKTGWERDNCILFNGCSTDHDRGRLDDRDRAELFAVDFRPFDQVFIVPVEDAATRVTRLRLRRQANNQSRRVRLAEDHVLECFEDRLVPSPKAAA